MSLATKAASLSKRGLKKPNTDYGSSACIMLLPRDEDVDHVKAFAAVDDLHCTVLYLGDMEKLKAKGVTAKQILDALQWIIATQKPIRGSFGGVTRFSGGKDDDADPVVLTVNSNDIRTFRDKIEAVCDSLGAGNASEFPYNPHMTLGFVDRGEDLKLPHWTETPVMFDRFWLDWGNEDHIIPFGNSLKANALLLQEKIIRTVRTEEGAERYGHPVGAVIVEHLDGTPEGGDVSMVDNEPVSLQDWYTDGQLKDVFSGGRGIAGAVQVEKPVQRKKRKGLKKRVAMMCPNKPLRVKALELATEQKDIVRTAAGVRKYGQPIGSVIVADGVLGGLTGAGKSGIPDFDLVKDKFGKEYVVGPDPDKGGGYYAAFGDDGDQWADVVVEDAATRNEALTLLDAATRRDRKPGTKPVYGSKNSNPTKINIPKKTPIKSAAKKSTAQRAKEIAKEAGTDKIPASKRASKKTPVKKRAAAAAKKRTPTVKSRITALKNGGGGGMSPEQKAGKTETVGLSAEAHVPKGVPLPTEIKNKAIKQNRQDPADYLIKDGKPMDSEGLRLQTALAIWGDADVVEHKRKLAEKNGRKFAGGVSPMHDNEHLWFPKDTDSGVAYSYRPAKYEYEMNEDGKPVPKKDKDGNPIIKGYGARAYIQTKDAKEANDAGKDTRVLAMYSDMHKLDAALKKEAHQNNINGQVAGAVLLMRTLGIRVGSLDEAGQAKADRSEVMRMRREAEGNMEATYGATTLQARHVRIEDGKAIIDFPGKDHVRNAHVVEDADVLQMLKAHMKGKKDRDQLFPAANSTATNNYVKSHIPFATNHNLRHFVATTLAARMVMADKNPPKTREELELRQMEIAEQVSVKALNNKAAQAFGTYINPAVWNTWKKDIK